MLLVSISAVLLCVVSLIRGDGEISFSSVAGSVSMVVTIDLLLSVWFVTKGWSLRVFRGWVVNIPDLRGTWVGHIQSNWKDAQGNSIGPIPAMLTVEQTLLTVSCVVRTPEMSSYSYNGAVRAHPEHGGWELNYSYTSSPSPLFSWRSPKHDGAARLSVTGGREYSLDGEYWTQRNTSGEIHLKKITTEKIHEFRKDLWDHPMKYREQAANHSPQGRRP